MLLEVSPIHKVDVSPVSQRYSTPTVLPVNAQIIRLIAFASNGISSNCLMNFSLFFQKLARGPFELRDHSACCNMKFPLYGRIMTELHYRTNVTIKAKYHLISL